MKGVGVFIALLISLASCKTYKNQPLDNKDFSAKIVQGEAVLQSISTLKTDTANLTIQYSYFDSKGQKLLSYQDSINQKIIDFIRGNTEFEFDKKENIQLDSTFFYRSLTFYDSLSRLESDLLEEGMLWELESSISIAEFKTFTELELSIWTYIGGAHGNGYSGFHLIDHATGKELHLSDFINDIPTFTELAEQYFRYENEIEEHANLTDEGFWFADGIFVCNENFYFEEGKMNFLFNNYEIAPYSAGQISFSIPLNELKSFLKIQP